MLQATEDTCSFTTLPTAGAVYKLRQFWEGKAHAERLSSQNSSINCQVKTITIGEKTILHQVDLSCTHCSSCFIIRVGHECKSKHKHHEQGLEWFQDQTGDNVNLAF